MLKYVSQHTAVREPTLLGQHKVFMKLLECDLVGSSPSQLPPGDVTGALREAILLLSLPGESDLSSFASTHNPFCSFTGWNFQREERSCRDGDQG